MYKQGVYSKILRDNLIQWHSKDLQVKLTLGALQCRPSDGQPLAVSPSECSSCSHFALSSGPPLSAVHPSPVHSAQLAPDIKYKTCQYSTCTVQHRQPLHITLCLPHLSLSPFTTPNVY